MNKIQRLSRIVKTCFQIVFFILQISSAIVWFGLLPSHILPIADQIPHGSSFISPTKSLLDPNTTYIITASTRILGFLSASVITGLQMLALHFLIQLFRCYEKSEIFSRATVTYLKKTAYVLFGIQLVSPIVEMLLDFLLTYHSPAGQHFIRASFGENDIQSLLLAGLLLLLSYIMAEGYKLKEDTRYIV